jgi:hypothetical protein
VKNINERSDKERQVFKATPLGVFEGFAKLEELP